jgi:hypothetical protein
LLTFKSVAKELEENPISPSTGREWTDRTKYINALFFKISPDGTGKFDPRDRERQGWQSCQYLQSCTEIEEELSEPLREEFRKQIEAIFQTYCYCIPAHASSNWLAGSSNKTRQGFIAFNLETGRRCDSNDPKSSWRSEPPYDMKKDAMWGLTADDILNEDYTKELIRKVDNYPCKEAYSWRVQPYVYRMMRFSVVIPGHR